MGSVTGFQAETPLHAKAREVLLAAFDQGWADPRKIHQASRKAAILRDEAREKFGELLQLAPDSIHFLGEAALGFHLGLTGLLARSHTLFLPAISRQEVFATRQSHEYVDGKAVELASDLKGSVLDLVAGEAEDVLAWQAVNGETGIRLAEPEGFAGRIFLDATSSTSPENGEWDAGLWESGTWAGPRGIGVFALRSPTKWRNPLPHLDSRVVPGDASLPLILTSAVALEHWRAEQEERNKKVRALNEKIRHFVTQEIGDVDIAGTMESAFTGEPAKLSFSFLYIDAERLVSELDRRGFAVDSGSACTSLEMKPSHVLAAMGLLTQGNIRLTLKMEHDERYVDSFLAALKEVVSEQR